MKNSALIAEVAVSLVFAGLVGILVFAQHAWMPDMLTMMLLGLAVILFGAFVVFVWREQDGDEREQLIRNLAGRMAYLATGAILLIGLIVETLVTYTPNVWLGLALITMVLAKVLAHAYGRRTH